MEKIELLAPAGSPEKARTAILYGADAVYIGGKQFSLRSSAGNFSLEEIKELCQFAHAHSAKVHVTVNMLPHEEDLDGLKEYLQALDASGIDAIIAASPGILQLARSLSPSYEIHVSTQHSTTNSAAVKFWKAAGMDRVVLARECQMEQIARIVQLTDLPVEVFIHGGMCISYSGRCVLSNYLTNRDANRGGCAQSCRWKYHLLENETEISDPENLFSMSSKDLQAAAQIEDFIKMGVSSLKIEGRMKSAYYLATVVSTYRRIIDWVYEQGTLEPDQLAWAEAQLAKAENRPTGPGFYKGIPDENVQLYRKHDESVSQEYVAQVIEAHPETGCHLIQVKNRFYPDEPLEIFGPSILPQPIAIKEIMDGEGVHPEVCNQPMKYFEACWEGPAEAYAMIRAVRK